MVIVAQTRPLELQGAQPEQGNLALAALESPLRGRAEQLPEVQQAAAVRGQATLGAPLEMEEPLGPVELPGPVELAEFPGLRAQVVQAEAAGQTAVLRAQPGRGGLAQQAGRQGLQEGEGSVPTGIR